MLNIRSGNERAILQRKRPDDDESPVRVRRKEDLSVPHNDGAVTERSVVMRNIHSCLYRHLNMQKNKETSTDLLCMIPMSFVLRFLGSVSVYRSVCKSFVSHSYVRDIVLRRESKHADVMSLITRRPSLKNLVFIECEYVTGPFLEEVLSAMPDLEYVKVDRCPLLMSYHALCSKRGCELSLVTGKGKTCRMIFRGCWRLFSRPDPCLSPVETIDVFMSALNYTYDEAMDTVNSFVSSNAWLVIPLRELNDFLDKEWEVVCTVSGEERMHAVVVIDNDLSLSMDVILCMVNQCWKIERMRRVYLPQYF